MADIAGILAPTIGAGDDQDAQLCFGNTNFTLTGAGQTRSRTSSPIPRSRHAIVRR
ncbi:hypothetical protein [Bradyrhizobium frederickii]|uniref:hypothetical protein n=1 Tax=Bradyrhizobium frederickii TaxID=2560054 RepID=UPI0014316B23|nr:hypothetical protein [Bradyrhizobium frederickii]